jgi:hypothetical protein
MSRISLYSELGSVRGPADRSRLRVLYMSTEVMPVFESATAIRVRSVNLAKEELLKGKRELEQELKTLNEHLVNMEAVERRSGHGQSLDALPVVKKDEFRGMRAVDALENYLRARRGFKIPLPRIVADLVEGGVDPGHARGKKSDPAALVSHTLKIGIPNRKAFGYHPDSISEKTGAHVIPKGVKDEEITVWLGDAADQPKRRKRTS